jgi:CRISPR/Cas system-associated exonuclease Cas4 (RecB family)
MAKKSFVKSGCVDEIVTPHYSRFLEKKGIQSRENRGFTHFHPSSFGGCVREIAIQYHGETDKRFRVEKPIDVDFMRICDAGHAFHHRMQRDLSIMGVLRGWWRCRSCGSLIGEENPIGIFLPEKCSCQKEEDKRKWINIFEYEEISLRSEPQYNFRGNCDGIVEIDPGNENSRYVVDFKTIKSERFDFLKFPESKYVIQVTIYMWLTGVKKSVIYYENKNDHRIKEFVVNYDNDLVEYIKNTSKKLKAVVEMGNIPKIPKGYIQSKPPCTWCDFKDFCYKK